MGSPADVPKDDAQVPDQDEGLLTFSRKARLPVPGKKGSVACITRGEVDLKSDANRGMLDVFARRTGKQVNYVDHVRAIVDRKTKRILLIPEEVEGDETARVHNFGSSHTIALGRLLVPAKLAVEKGYTEVYPVFPEMDARYGWVLVVDLASLQERRSSGKKPPKAS